MPPASPTGVAGPAPAAPPRRPGSVRRTMTIDARWPEGLGGLVHFDGRCRDLVTPPGGGEAVSVEDRVEVVASADRVLRTVSSEPPRELDALVGVRAGGGLRRAVAAVVAPGSPLHLLLDDLAGASLVAPFAWSQWPATTGARQMRGRTGPTMVGVCAGFRPGSSGLTATGSPRWSQQVQRVAALAGDDPLGWHELVETSEVSHRRARRLDVQVVGDEVHVDTHFQDSVTVPDGGRVAVHEYLLTAVTTGGVLTAVEADPRVLPYDECPAAADNVASLVGVPLADLRLTVPTRLRGTLGCTHLNDVLRSLADVPYLAGLLG